MIFCIITGVLYDQILSSSDFEALQQYAEVGWNLRTFIKNDVINSMYISYAYFIVQLLTC